MVELASLGNEEEDSNITDVLIDLRTDIEFLEERNVTTYLLQTLKSSLAGNQAQRPRREQRKLDLPQWVPIPSLHERLQTNSSNKGSKAMIKVIQETTGSATRYTLIFPMSASSLCSPKDY